MLRFFLFLSRAFETVHQVIKLYKCCVYLFHSTCFGCMLCRDSKIKYSLTLRPKTLRKIHIKGINGRQFQRYSSSSDSHGSMKRLQLQKRNPSTPSHYAFTCSCFSLKYKMNTRNPTIPYYTTQYFSVPVMGDLIFLISYV